MSKNISIILKKRVPQIGKKGDILHVKRGYAFNYIIPNKIGELASKGRLKHAKMLAHIQTQKTELIRVKAKQLQKKLENIAKISIKKKTGNQQHIFGNISNKEIAEEIFKYTGIQIDKKQIQIPDIKITGVYSITIQILEDIKVNIKLHILPINI